MLVLTFQARDSPHTLINSRELSILSCTFDNRDALPMIQPADNQGRGVDDTLEIPSQPMGPTRNRGPSRCYNVAMVVVYFILLILAVVALGTFGKKQAEITQRRHQRNDYEHTCILFTTTLGYNDDGVWQVKLHSAALCGYVLWGLASVAIVVFVWLIYSIAQAIIGPKM